MVFVYCKLSSNVLLLLFCQRVNAGKVTSKAGWDEHHCSPEPWNHGLFQRHHPQMAEHFRLVKYYNLSSDTLYYDRMNIPKYHKISTCDIFAGMKMMKIHNYQPRFLLRRAWTAE